VGPRVDCDRIATATLSASRRNAISIMTAPWAAIRCPIVTRVPARDWRTEQFEEAVAKIIVGQQAFRIGLAER
jgi:hypothetical protein